MANTTKHRSKGMQFRHALVFYRAWVRHPLSVGAIVPSSRGLADLITAEITTASAPILELGPGTGVFTKALLKRGIPEDKLTLVEFDSGLAYVLQLQFPAAQVVCGDAARLGTASLFDGERVGAVVSGLPLLSMSRRKVMAILDASFRHMRPGAAFYQFTYGRRCPIPRAILDRLGLKATRLRTAFANVPPATVYCICSRQPSRLRGAM